ncbi:MAG: hypothetical protein O3C21_18650 [Verrucomicrobia bacterium]|nr:hypothetical protein [Verrucomicrobiota bacterium]
MKFNAAKDNAGKEIGNRGVEITVGTVLLHGILTVPALATGAVILVNEGGGGRYNPRNRYIAGRLNEVGYSTLLFDLLAASEEVVVERSGGILSLVQLLALRLSEAIKWVRSDDMTNGMPIGLFGAGIGAAAMLIVASRRPDEVGAVVSLDGILDQPRSLRRVRSPTLLIVWADDPTTLKSNEAARKRIVAECELKTVKNDTVQGETHPVSEPGEPGEVSRLSCEWFRNKLALNT